MESPDPSTIARELIDRLQKHASILTPTNGSSTTTNFSLPEWLTSLSATSSSSSSPLGALGALFRAYDNRIDELTTSNRALLETLNKSKGMIENLIQENQTLRTTNQSLLLQQSSSNSSSVLGTTTNYPSSLFPSSSTYSSMDADKALLAAEVASIREEIGLLRRKNIDLTQDINSKETTLTTLLNQQKTMAASLTTTQAALRHVDTEKRKFENENKKYTRLLTEVQEQRDNYYLQITNLTKDVYDSSNQITQYRNALNELSTAASNEAETLTNQAKQAIERSETLKVQVEELTTQLDSARTELTILRQETLFLRSDGERMLKILRDLENKVVGVEEREEIARTAKITADTIKANAEHEIMVAKQSEEETKQELIKFLQRRKEEILTAQQHETEAVNHIRNRLTEIITARDAEINTLRQEMVLTKELMERANRDVRTLTDQKNQLKDHFTKEQEKLNQIIPELTQRATLAEEGKVAAEATARDASLKMTTALATIEITKQDLQTQFKVAKDTIDRLTIQLTESESKGRTLTLQLTETERSLHSVKRENQDMRNRMNETTTALSLHRSKGGGGPNYYNNGSYLTASFLGGGKDDRGTYDRLGQETAYIDEIAELKGRIQDLTSLLHAIQKDYTAAVTAAKEADESLAQVRNAYVASEGIIVELTSQLHSATQREDARLREVQEARTTAELTKLTNVRLQAKVDSLTSRYEQTEKENIETRAQLRVMTMISIHGGGGGGNSIHGSIVPYNVASVSGTLLPVSSVRPPFVPSSQLANSTMGGGNLHQHRSSSLRSTKLYPYPNSSSSSSSSKDNNDDGQSWLSNSIESNDMDEKLVKLGIVPQPLDPYARSALAMNASLGRGSSKPKSSSKNRDHHRKHRHAKEKENNASDTIHRRSHERKDEPIVESTTESSSIKLPVSTQRSVTTVEIVEEEITATVVPSSQLSPPASSLDIMTAVQAKIDKFYGVPTITTTNTNLPVVDSTVNVVKEAMTKKDTEKPSLSLTTNTINASSTSEPVVVVPIHVQNTVPFVSSERTQGSLQPKIMAETDEIVPVLNTSSVGTHSSSNGRITNIARLPILRGSSPVITSPSVSNASTANIIGNTTAPTNEKSLSPSFANKTTETTVNGVVVPFTPPSSSSSSSQFLIKSSLLLHEHERTPSPEKVLEMMTTNEEEINLEDDTSTTESLPSKQETMNRFPQFSTETEIINNNHAQSPTAVVTAPLSPSTPVSTEPSIVEGTTVNTVIDSSVIHETSSILLSPVPVRTYQQQQRHGDNTNDDHVNDNTTPLQKSNDNHNLFTIENSQTPSSIHFNQTINTTTNQEPLHNLSTSGTLTRSEEDISDYYGGQSFGQSSQENDSGSFDDDDDDDNKDDQNNGNEKITNNHRSSSSNTTSHLPSSSLSKEIRSTTTEKDEFGDTKDINLLSPGSDDFDDDDDDQLDDGDDDDAF